LKNLPHKIRAFFWRWHKRVGLLLALPLIPIVVSGFFLNHTASLNLAKVSITSPSLLQAYGISLPELQSITLEGTRLVGDANNNIYMSNQFLTQCRGKITGAMTWQTYYVIACENELLLISRIGEIQERINSTYGLPVPIHRIGNCDDSICIESHGVTYVADLEQLNWPATNDAVEWNTPKSYVVEPDQLKNIDSGLTLERVLQDVHSGRIWGGVGIFLVDLIGIFLLFLALSGAWLWFNKFARSIKRK
jgi:hypothetical protein